MAEVHSGTFGEQDFLALLQALLETNAANADPLSCRPHETLD